MFQQTKKREADNPQSCYNKMSFVSSAIVKVFNWFYQAITFLTELKHITCRFLQSQLKSG